MGVDEPLEGIDSRAVNQNHADTVGNSPSSLREPVRKIISVDPLIETVANEYHFENSPWPAKWIGHPSDSRQGPVVLAFRRCFELATAKTVTLHVSADQRY